MVVQPPCSQGAKNRLLTAYFRTSPKGAISPAMTPERPNMLSDYFSEQEAAAELGKTVRTLRKWRRERKGPPYTYFGKTVRYRKPAVIEYYRRTEIDPKRTKQHR